MSRVRSRRRISPSDAHAAGHATGIHKVGGTVGATARKVSHGEKHVARKAKHQLKTSKAKAHGDLTKAGKDAKAEVKKP